MGYPDQYSQLAAEGRRRRAEAAAERQRMVKEIKSLVQFLLQQEFERIETTQRGFAVLIEVPFSQSRFVLQGTLQTAEEGSDGASGEKEKKGANQSGGE